jgi:hypothetical protein
LAQRVGEIAKEELNLCQKKRDVIIIRYFLRISLKGDGNQKTIIA